MSARWHETQPERREDAGPGGTVACAFLAFVLVYVALHAVLWVGSAVIA